MTNAPEPSSSLGARAVRGGLTMLAGNGLMRILGFLSVSVLGRLLTPEDFGVVALALVVTGLSEALLNKQFAQALIRMPEAEPEHFDTAFTLTLGFGLTFGGLVFALSWSIADFMDSPELGPVLRALSLAPILDSAANPYFIRFAKGLRFGRVVQNGLAARMTSVAAGILAAAQLGNYWALVIAALTYSITRVGLTYAMAPERPRLSLGRSRELAAFGLWLSGSGALTFAGRKLGVAAIGRVLDTRAAGHYHLGLELAQMITTQIGQMLGSVLYPSLSAANTSPERLAAAYGKAQSVVFGVMAPLGAGAALASNEIVYVVLGPQWTATAEVLRILAPMVALSGLATGAQAIVMIHNSNRSLFIRNLTLVGLSIPVTIWAAQAYGVLGVAAARGAFAVLNTMVSLVLAAHLLRMNAAVLQRCARSAVAVCAMVVAITLVFDSGARFNDFSTAAASLTAKVVIGAAAFVATLLTTWLAAGKPDGLERILIEGLVKLTRTMGRTAARP